ncbi:SUKH-4 family immunity protein [Phytohabitans flavus]|uniref:Uncharacterized protein n=1 Tax=Phytohabitans flavus TaxID=1076124 RepID=A0A6F8XLZ2_9ACTN|nr:SUKH-4 family immunity protein [Phytohabitans flavus]BCB74801.1 hypothetical protein Pflav_012110 [Phytohabitans flavus]
MAARAGSGEVLAVPTFTYDEVHPQLQHMFPDGVRPVLLNSSVARLVDFAWRWHWLLPVLTAQQTWAGAEETTAWGNARTPEEKAALPDFYAEIRELCEEVVERFRQFDGPAVSNEDSPWREAVMEYL